MRERAIPGRKKSCPPRLPESAFEVARYGALGQDGVFKMGWLLAEIGLGTLMTGTKEKI